MGSRILASRYELLEKIGEGGMAVVFRAKDRVLSRYVAVKILRPEYINDQQFIERFRTESQIAASIVDPNIVNVYDVGREGNIYYIVMELVDGLPLSETIKSEAPLDPRRAVNIARQIASALSTAHHHNLIHRDVKPHNILLGEGDVAKIADFGIAKIISDDTLAGEQQEAVMGSIHYFSPEQARGKGVDERSDIYALGIVLFEMITGQVPFDGETAVEVAVKHLNEKMTPPSHLNPKIPQDIEDIIFKATAKNPDDRYNNVDEMITDLSFVKYSKPSDYSVEIEKSKAGESDSAPAEKEPPKESPDEARARKRDEKAKKKAKFAERFKLSNIAAVVLAILLAIPVSSFVFNTFLKPEQQVSDDVAVPVLIQREYSEALEFIVQYDLNLEVTEKLHSNEYPEGYIMNQSPATGTVVKRGSTVNIVLSLGPENEAIPNVVGKTESNAKFVLETYNYTLGTVKKAYSDTIPVGAVISQDPEKGTLADKGTAVNVVISLGAKNSGNTTPTTDTDGNTKVVIPAGSSGNKVGDLLVEAKLVESRETFVSKLKEMKYDTKLKAGTYTIPKDATLEQIIRLLSGEKL